MSRINQLGGVFGFNLDAERPESRFVTPISYPGDAVQHVGWLCLHGADMGKIFTEHPPTTARLLGSLIIERRPEAVTA